MVFELELTRQILFFKYQSIIDQYDQYELFFSHR